MDTDVREILKRQLERLDAKAARNGQAVGTEQFVQITNAMCEIADRLDPPPVFMNRAKRREDDAAEAATLIVPAYRYDNNMLVFNRADGKKLVIRRVCNSDEPGEQDTVMVEIFDEDMGGNFNPELEMGHGASMTAQVFTEALRKVVDAPDGYNL